jgi:D-beta-D-heptose 7-phosphate kinase / D-beta-D-heptose 1-phosphate adenosyltransferase
VDGLAGLKRNTMKHLIELIDRWQPRRVIVVGDFMLDEHLYGNAERLSPDAPVPILAVERQSQSPGGASNVCMDLAALRCEVTCIGVTGCDGAGEALRQKLWEAGCQMQYLLQDPGRPTTVKRSYVGLAQHRHPQKMFRVDFEETGALHASLAEKLLAHVRDALAGADLLCIEDYNKGVLAGGTCEKLIAMARAAGMAVLVDPAAIDDYRRYRGATAITPNRTEAEKATGMVTGQIEYDELAGRRLMDELELEAVILTLDKHGALLLERGGQVQHVPTEARTVYDVTGAGDMVLAALAGARANGADWLTAVQLANFAAGLEVEKFGCVPIPLDEVLLNLYQRGHHGMGKFRTVRQLVPELEAHRRAGRRIAFTNGCFDIIHAGHIQTLRGARGTADLLVLAVNSDASIRALKGPTRPVVPEDQRLTVLSELECVDYLVLFGDGTGGENDTPRPLLRALKPDVLVKGGTYGHDEVVGWDIVESYGGRVVTIPPVEGLSTSDIVQRIRGA